MGAFLIEKMPEKWREILHETINGNSFASLAAFVEEEYKKEEIFPAYNEIFSAFIHTPPEKVKAVILGQDPYHEPGQAHGLAFSVKEDVKFPPSLRNIFKEYESDTTFSAPKNGSLIPWAKEGVLLLNTVLTVRKHEANSHKGKGWEEFTDGVIQKINTFPEHIVFLLWGTPAQKKIPLIDKTKHTILSSAHPSPLSAYRGFFGSSPFSRCNEALMQHGREIINWKL